MIVAVIAYAAGAMFIQDILGVMLTQAQARNRAALSGALDSLTWIAAIATTTVSVTALQGHNLALKAGVVVSVTIANYFGCMIGVKIGEKYIKEEPDAPPAPRKYNAPRQPGSGPAGGR